MKLSPAQAHIIEPDFLLMAYCSGFFPMAESREGEIRWYSPDPRAIIELDQFVIPRSLSLTLKKRPFDIRINSMFEGVMRRCGEREETWISEEIVQSYVKLHEMGFAHSVECWRGGVLAGGLYGVAIGGAFFGESMFSAEKDASKVALAYLVDRLRARGHMLLDTQFMTPHLARFGAKEIPRKQYLERLGEAIKQTCMFID
jgi:leucyl/phenylalanyl-tRNA--protein transferase